MKLLEYNAKQFLDQNRFSNERKDNIRRGYNFGLNEFFNIDFWIKKDSKYTYIDFIYAVNELNSKIYNINKIELIENLARFLCGYDLQVQDRNNVVGLPSIQQHNYFQNQKDFIDAKVTDRILSEKISLINSILNTV